MAIPIVYNFRSVRARWTSAIVAVLGIAGTVGVFVAMLSLARGFKATLVSSGSEDNAIIMRAGATSEMTGGVALELRENYSGRSGHCARRGRPAGHARSRGRRADSPDLHGHRRQRAGSRRLEKCAGDSQANQNRARPNVQARTGRSGRRQERQHQLLRVDGWQHHQPWQCALESRGSFRRRRQLFRFRSLGGRARAGPGYNRGENFFQSVTVHLTSPDSLAATERRADRRSAPERGRHARNRLLRQAIQSSDHTDYHLGRRWWQRSWPSARSLARSIPCTPRWPNAAAKSPPCALSVSAALP